MFVYTIKFFDPVSWAYKKADILAKSRTDALRALRKEVAFTNELKTRREQFLSKQSVPVFNIVYVNV